MQLNYFKPFDEVIADFKKLKICQQSEEMTSYLNQYLRMLKDDTMMRVSSQQTKNTGELYKLMNEAHLQSCRELSL